jgi:hypothetical protein
MTTEQTDLALACERLREFIAKAKRAQKQVGRAHQALGQAGLNDAARSTRYIGYAVEKAIRRAEGELSEKANRLTQLLAISNLRGCEPEITDEKLSDAQRELYGNR